MKGALAIFVKTPGLSQIKTRLAKGIGRQQAEDFYRMSARVATEIGQRVSAEYAVDSYHAVAENEGLQYPQWQDLPCLWQGEGGLGERMFHIYQTLLKTYDYVVLTGSDIPQMTVPYVEQAIASLQSQQNPAFVLAPCVDGGFCLFGGNTPVPLHHWTDVEYSQPDTGAEFQQQITGLGPVQRLSILDDVDEVEDLKPLQHSLSALAEPLPAQLELLTFLQNLT